ncbi:MAG: MFS transporter [Halobacteriales archaeon]
MNSNDRAIVGLVMVAHGLVHTYELSIPILVGIWLAELPVTPASIGTAVTVGTAFFGLGALPAGVLADRYGSQRLIVVSLLGMGGSFVLLRAADGVVGIAAALSLWGVAASVYHPSGLSLISKGVSRRGVAFAYHGMAGNLGIALGPLVTALLLIAFDWRLVVVALAVPAGVGAAFALRVDVDEAAAVEADGGRDADGSGAGDGDGRAGGVSSLGAFLAESRLLFTSAFALVFVVLLLSGLYYRGVTTFLPDLFVSLPGLGSVELGRTTLEPSRFVYAGLLMVGMGGQYVGGKLTDRYPTEWGLAVGYGALAVVAAVFLPVANLGFVPMLVVAALLGFFLFVVQPFYQATVAEYSPPETRGLSYGFTYLGVFGIGALGAVLAGWLLTLYSPLVLFGVLAAIAGLASAVGFVLTRLASPAGA